MLLDCSVLLSSALFWYHMDSLYLRKIKYIFNISDNGKNHISGILKGSVTTKPQTTFSSQPLGHLWEHSIVRIQAWEEIA